MEIEYRVKPINRFIVTRFESSEQGGSVRQVGEYSSPEVAYEVAYALAKAEHERLGWPVDDERIKYPTVPAEMCKDGPLPPR